MPKSKELVSSSDSDESDSGKPKQKKKKVEKSPEKSSSSSKSASKSKKTVEKGPGGEYMFQLSKMRYATVSEFRGKVMIGIREYYMTDDEQLRPGKKGISLTAEQWQALKDNIEDIDEAAKKF